MTTSGVRVRVVVHNASFKNIWEISWLSVLLVEETRIPGENHTPAGCDLTTLVVIETDFIGSCKSNYHTIMNSVTPLSLVKWYHEMKAHTEITADCHINIAFETLTFQHMFVIVIRVAIMGLVRQLGVCLSHVTVPWDIQGRIVTVSNVMSMVRKDILFLHMYVLYNLSMYCIYLLCIYA